MGPITVFPARKVVTMDPGRPVAEAVAVMDGKVLSTGSLTSMRPWLSRHPHVIDDTFEDQGHPAGVHRPAYPLRDVLGLSRDALRRTD